MSVIGCNVNCKHFDKFGNCNHPEKSKSFWIFKPLCIEYGHLGERCNLAERYPRSKPPQGGSGVLPKPPQAPPRGGSGVDEPRKIPDHITDWNKKLKKNAR